MNQPRPAPSTQTTIPQPDVRAVIDYARFVLGIQLSDWQRNALTQAVIGYGIAFTESELHDDQSSSPAHALTRPDDEPIHNELATTGAFDAAQTRR